MKHELVKLCVDTVKGRVQNYSSTEANEVIRKAFVELVGTEKPDYKTFRRFKPEIFEIIEESLAVNVTDGLVNNPFFEQFVEYRDLDLGDTNEFYVEDRSLLAVSEVANGTWNLRRQKLDIGDSFTVKTRTYGIKIYADFLRLLAGRLDWTAFVAKVDQSIRQHMAEEMYVNFMSAGNYLPAQFKKAGSFTEDQMDDIVSHVQASNNFAPVVIAGTRKALRKIVGTYSNTNGFLVSETMKEQLNNQGMFANWNGIPLLEIPQVHAANTFNFAVDDNKLLVLPASAKPIKVVREGQPLILDNSQGSTNMDMSVEYTFIMKYGVNVVFNELFGLYELA
ncbi:hypothetical protein WKH56_20815 [Priestia sp. SB1]|uniref:hypothetical protein n=1 Tax=Priestia TaxID=2800373 RepID=UPI002877C31F|nr:hypothetical protein [Priestia megaterium]